MTTGAGASYGLLAGSIAFLTAAMMALLVTVAEATVSTSALFAATIFAGSSSMALVPMFGVSLWLSTVTAAILSPSMVTVTVSSPPKPLAMPVRASACARVAMLMSMMAISAMERIFFIVVVSFAFSRRRYACRFIMKV